MEPLSREVFEEWRKGHDERVGTIMGFIRAQGELNLDAEHRMTEIETVQHNQQAAVVTRTTWISAIVSAIVGALGGLFAAGK